MSLATPNIEVKLIKKTNIIKGAVNDAASLMLLAYALMIEMSTTKIKTVVIKTINIKLYVTGPYMSSVKFSLPTSRGSDKINPKKLDVAETMTVILSAKILPKAISERLTGVAKRVAIVPRSFSPAMASEAMA